MKTVKELELSLIVKEAMVQQLKYKIELLNEEIQKLMAENSNMERTLEIKQNHILMKEIERLNNIIKKGITEEMKDELDVILKTNQKQAHRIYKAIEYIEQHNDYFLLKREVKELLSILKGDKKE